MDGFGDNFDDNDIDPAAEFIAREQNQLAGLEDEVQPALATLNIAGNGMRNEHFQEFHHFIY